MATFTVYLFPQGEPESQRIYYPFLEAQAIEAPDVSGALRWAKILQFQAGGGRGVSVWQGAPRVGGAAFIAFSPRYETTWRYH